MKTLTRTFVLIGSLGFALGAVAGCGDDDNNTTFDAKVNVDAKVVDAPIPTFDAAIGSDAKPADAKPADAASGG